MQDELLGALFVLVLLLAIGCYEPLPVLLRWRYRPTCVGSWDHDLLLVWEAVGR